MIKSMGNSSSSHDRDRGRGVFAKGKHHDAYLVIVVEVVRMPEDEPSDGGDGFGCGWWC